MKKLYTTLTVCAATLSLWAASDRIDFKAADGSFISRLLDGIKEIRYEGSDNGFSHAVLTNANGEEEKIEMQAYPTVSVCVSDPSLYYAITCEEGEHTQLILWNSNNNGQIDPTLPDDWKGSEVDRINNLDWYSAPGYDADIVIKGDYTGHVYSDDHGFVFISPAESNLLGITTRAFRMPNEPVTVSSVATELSTYAGESFVGIYKGININSEGTVVKGKSATLDLNANAAYTFTTTDASALNLNDNYKYDSVNKTFEFQREEREYYQSDTKIGVFGWEINPDFYMVQVRDLDTNKPEDVINFAMCKSDAAITSLHPADNVTRVVVAYEPAEGKALYYILSEYGYIRTAVSADFVNGNTMAGDFTAILSQDEKPLIKAISEEGNVTFIDCGIEYGVYESTDGLGDLSLDGFGTARIGEYEYSYTIDGNVVTLTQDGVSRSLLIDMQAKTYSDITTSAAWDGAAEYLLNPASGTYRGEESDNNVIQILFDTNLLGNSYPGYAAVRIWFGDTDMTRYAGIADVKKYVYDPDQGKIIIAGLLVGDGNATDSGSSYGYANITLNVSEDKGSLTIDPATPKIYSFNLPDTWVNTSTPIPAVSTGAEWPTSFSGNAPVYHSSMGAIPTTSGKVVLDKDADGNEKAGYATIQMQAFTTYAVNACVPYSIDGNVITFEGLKFGDAMYADPSARNLTMELNDGVLKGSGDATTLWCDYTVDYSLMYYYIRWDEVSLTAE